MKVEFEGYINEEVGEELRSRYYKYVATKIFDKDTILNFKGMDDGNYLLDLCTALDKKPISTIGDIFTAVVRETYRAKVTFSTEERIDEDEYFVAIEINISDFSVVTKVNDIRLYMYDDGIEVSEHFQISIQESSIDNFKCDVRVQGRIKADANTTHYGVVDSLDLFAELDVMGIKKNSSPIWVENIVAGTIFAEIGNSRMAFMSYFSALDEFINLAYEELEKVYDVLKPSWIANFGNQEFDAIKDEFIFENNERVYEKYSYADKFFEFILDRLDRVGIDIKADETRIDELELSYGEFIDEECRKEQCSFLTRELENKVNSLLDLSELKDYIDKKISDYGKIDRRLKEKLKDILKNLGITGDNIDYNQFYILKSNFGKYELFRNDIAHGREFNGEAIEGFLFFVLCIIFTITFSDDFANKGWDNHMFN
ncbi:MAG: hypothetical protein CVU95_15445 [Firmicutes bacterium HGW-Firmicutes-2]|jgi:hypothetical protein|nr:MAG: hypothetical protein CVU95_15445 [Firmicutes bacterium HGW-Firmicutes-2]